MNHIMLDLETMGSESNSAILSIGAVYFNIETGETGETFHKHIKLRDSIDIGLQMNPSTVLWWLAQSNEAQEKLLEGQKATLKIKDVLGCFSNFCKAEIYNNIAIKLSDSYIWGNSARFDCGLLQNAYNKLEIPIPWDFRKERCLRTLVSFAPDIASNWVRIGTAHDALDDCYNQIGYCCEIWKTLNKS